MQALCWIRFGELGEHHTLRIQRNHLDTRPGRVLSSTIPAVCQGLQSGLTDDELQCRERRSIERQQVPGTRYSKRTLGLPR